MFPTVLLSFQKLRTYDQKLGIGIDSLGRAVIPHARDGPPPILDSFMDRHVGQHNGLDHQDRAHLHWGVDDDAIIYERHHAQRSQKR